MRFHPSLLLAALLSLLAQPFLSAQDEAPPAPAMGLVFDVASYRGTPYKATLTAASYENIPKQVSLTQYCPTPGDQGQYGTCTAFAVAYHTRTILWGIEHRETSKTKLNSAVFSPAFLYDQIKEEGDTDCSKGSNIIHALELLRTMGVPTNRTVPYACGPNIPANALDEAFEYPIEDYQILFLPDVKDRDVRVNTVKKSLAEGWPVALAFTVPQSFYQPPAIWKPLASDNGPTGQHGAHAMVVVGYDDAKGGTGAFHVINSWGPKWCENGYVWIPYNAFAEYAIGALQVYGKRPPPLPPPPPPKPKPGPPPPPPPPTPAYHSLLEGRISFQRNDGVPMPARRTESSAGEESLSAYQLDRAYPSGTRFRFFIETNTEVYLYAFATDLSQEITQILPFEDNMSALLGPNSAIAFPSERKVVRMDKNPGTDYMLILYSSHRLDPVDLRAKLQAETGSLSHRIQRVLSKRLVSSNQVRLDRDGIGFSVDRTSEGSIVPLMVEIVHN